MKKKPFAKQTYVLFSLLVLVMLMLAACQPAAATEVTEEPAVLPTAEATATTAATEPMEATATEAPEPTEAATAEVPATGSATINVANDPNLGEILVDGEGMTLYMFTKDEPNVSNCEGECLVNWPPLVSEGEVTAGEGVDQSLIGSADLPDGTQIVTYNGMPLYYWINDKAPGDTTGQDVGEVWYVVSPEGEPIMEAGESATGEASEAGTATLNVVSDPNFGDILVDNKGMVLYIFTKDEPNKVNCAGECLVNWPPLVAEGEVTVGEGVDESLVGSADLPDGRKIVTYNEMPLYYWINDKQPGDTTGQDVGEVWYVISPAGEPVMEAGESAAGEASEGITVDVATDPELGDYLVDSKGMALYMFTKDEPNKVNCAGQCLEAWPPLVAAGTIVAGEGVDDSLFGTADLPDGSKIVTYNEMPLYYWVNDKNPGDTTGQGVNEVWYLVSPSGEPIGMP